jgi:PAS domain S-box-containing protein
MGHARNHSAMAVSNNKENGMSRIKTSGLAALIRDSGMLTQFQTYKGWVFILITATLVLVLSRRALLETERLAASIQESEGRFRALFENVSVVALVIDPSDGSILDANEAAAAFYGWPREQLRSMRITQINTVTPEELRMRMDEAANRKQGFFRFQHRRADGSVRDVEVYSGPIQFKERTALYSVIHDVTERKLAKEALRESAEKYRFLVEATNTGYVVIDDRGRVVDANQEYVRMTGRGRLEDILGRPVTEWTAAYDLERNAAEVRKCVESGSVRNLMIDYVDTEGRITPVEINATVLQNELPLRIFSICRDITERKRAEEELRESRRYLEMIIETVPT